MTNYCRVVFLSRFFHYLYMKKQKRMNAIYMTDLAQRYFPRSSPRSAITQLRRWVQLNSDLRQRLDELHYHKSQRSLTPLQHAAFIKYLGEPGE